MNRGEDVTFDKRLNEHEYNLHVLQELGCCHLAPIPARVAVSEANACGQTIWEYADDSIRVVRAAYVAVLRALGVPPSREMVVEL